ncbi:MAG: glycosyltransferase family 2 protein, partial [Chloroflexi bacterium]
LISVIIPTWNSARFLPQALDSVFAQQYEPCEVIVVDDGSTDNTAVILGAYADRITCIRQANAGSASARNTGLQHARGEYVVFLDADDWLLPGKLHVQADFLNTHPEYGMAHSGWFLCDEAGNVLQIVEPWTEVPDLTLVNWLKHRPVNLGAFMFRREWLERVGGMDPSLRQSHDVDLVLRLALAGCQAGWVCLPTMAYRRHRKSTTLAGALQQARCSVAVIDRFFERPDLPPEVAEMATGTRYYSALWAAWYLLDKGLVEEVASYLQLCRSLSEKRPLPLVFDWLTHLVRWTERAGRPVEQVMAIVPVVAAVVPEVANGLWERFVGWWLARRPFLAADAFALA